MSATIDKARAIRETIMAVDLKTVSINGFRIALNRRENFSVEEVYLIWTAIRSISPAMRRELTANQ